MKVRHKIVMLNSTAPTRQGLHGKPVRTTAPKRELQFIQLKDEKVATNKSISGLTRVESLIRMSIFLGAQITVATLHTSEACWATEMVSIGTEMKYVP